MKKNGEISLRTIQRKLFLLGIFKIPMIGFVRPRLIYIDDKSVKVKIRLKRRTKNHLNSMYFGALAVGADIAAGIHVFYFSEALGKRVSFAFKSISGEFVQRAETETYFECIEGNRIKELILKAESSGERLNDTVEVKATNSMNEVVAIFEMGISVRVK
jgi:hypothetical protein